MKLVLQYRFNEITGKPRCIGSPLRGSALHGEDGATYQDARENVIRWFKRNDDIPENETVEV
jgi:hypothetical protein